MYLGMMPVAQIDIDAQGQESVVYFLTDQLATPRLGIDQSQAVVWKWESDAYGSIAPTGSVTVNLRFAGQYFDAESGWYYNWNRYYLPKDGRYLTSDPIGLKGGLNTYGYVDENPLNYADPTGENAVWAGRAGWAIGGAINAAIEMGIGVPLGIAIYDWTHDDTEGCKPTKAECSKAIKLLEQVERLAQKLGKKLPPKRLADLAGKISNGSITSNDLPGDIQNEFPPELRGKTLSEIRRICGKSR